MDTELSFQNVFNAVADFLESSGDRRIAKGITLSLIFGVTLLHFLEAADQIQDTHKGITNQTPELVNWLESSPKRR